VHGPVDLAHAAGGDVRFDLKAAVEERAGLEALLAELVGRGAGGHRVRRLLR